MTLFSSRYLPSMNGVIPIIPMRGKGISIAFAIRSFDSRLLVSFLEQRLA